MSGKALRNSSSHVSLTRQMLTESTSLTVGEASLSLCDPQTIAQDKGLHEDSV